MLAPEVGIINRMVRKYNNAITGMSNGLSYPPINPTPESTARFNLYQNSQDLKKQIASLYAMTISKRTEEKKSTGTCDL